MHKNCLTDITLSSLLYRNIQKNTMDKPKHTVITFRITEEEKEQFRKKAFENYKTMSDYLRSIILK